MRRKRVALVLGGGGARGLAHLGVLRVFQREGIPVDLIVGTSAGAIIGGMYASCPDAERLIERVLGFLGSDSFRRYKLVFEFKNGGGEGSLFRRLFKGIRKNLAMQLLFQRSSVFPGGRLHNIIQRLIPEGTFEDLKIPLAVTAVELKAGREVVLNRGPLVDAITASASVPGFFPPVEMDDMLLCDAGLIDNMPIRVAKSFGAEVIIAVNLNYHLESFSEVSTGIEVIFRSEEIGTKIVNDLKAPSADVVVTPELPSRYWLDFEDVESVVEAGEQAALIALDQVLSVVDRVRPAAT